LILGSCFVAVAAWAAVAPPRRAILVSFDGLGGLDLARRLAAGELSPDGFARAAGEGFSADRLAILAPSRTAVSHASISAGGPPSATGIVENTMYVPGTAPGARVHAFEAESRVETLWEAAARQGTRVASIGWPGAWQGTARTRTPIALRYVENVKDGILYEGPRGPLVDAKVALPLGTDSFAPPKSFRVEKDDRDRPLALTFVAIDSTDDGRRAYDQLLAFDAHGALVARARAGDWFSATERRDEDEGDRDVLFGRWGKLLELAPDLSRIALYLGPASRNRAQPDDFRRTLDARVGVWPEPPDVLFLKRAQPDTASFVEQAARFSRYFVHVYEVARRRGDWRLLMAYQPLVDEAEHPLLLVEPRQPGYTKARASQYAAALRQVVAAADRAAAEYLKFEEEGDVFFVSDHGMRPVRRAYAIREALRRRGWIKMRTGADGKSEIAPDTPVEAVSGGGILYVFVNRAAPGMTEARATALAREIVEDLRSRRDEEDAPLFSMVVPRRDAGPLGLDTPNAGDVIAIAAGATTLTNGFAKDFDQSLFAAPENPGQHGYEADPKLDGIFFHVGEGVARERVTTFRAIDVAGRIALRLGLDPFGTAR
jgi:hypothetical protein